MDNGPLRGQGNIDNMAMSTGAPTDNAPWSIGGLWQFAGSSAEGSRTGDGAGLPYLQFAPGLKAAEHLPQLPGQGAAMAQALTLPSQTLAQQPATQPLPPVAERTHPVRARLGEWIGDHLTMADIPRFQTAASVIHHFQGVRPGGVEGAVLRFDTGRTVPPDGVGRNIWGAINTLAWGQRQGLSFVSIARDGTILLPANFDWMKWGSHAGQTICPVSGRQDLSQRYLGISINGPGQVYPTPDADCFVPWFNAARDEMGYVRLNVYEEARCLNRSDEWYRRSDVVMVADRKGSVAAGVHVPMSQAQQESLVVLMLWLKRTFPKTFQFDQVFAANEVTRQTLEDDGGSIGFFNPQSDPSAARTMADFRHELSLRWSLQLARMAHSHFRANDLAR